MIINFRHVGLVVTDLEKAKTFWCDLLGFKLIKEMDEFGPHIDEMMGLVNVRVTTAKLRAPDNSMLELLFLNPIQISLFGKVHLFRLGLLTYL